MWPKKKKKKRSNEGYRAIFQPHKGILKTDLGSSYQILRDYKYNAQVQGERLPNLTNHSVSKLEGGWQQ